jgi:hypothetical protein
MNQLVLKASEINGSGTIFGRSLACCKFDYQKRVRLAADIATGVRSFQPTLSSICRDLTIRPTDLRTELNARAAAAHALGEQLDAELRRGVQPAYVASDLVDVFETLSDLDRVEVFKRIGIGRIFDALEKADSR